MARRFRPTFSVRTLAIFVTLACAYFGAWEATKKYGQPRLSETLVNRMASFSGSFFMRTPAPFLIAADEHDPAVSRLYGNKVEPYVRRYYFWFFGLIVQLPPETNCPSSALERFADPFR